MIKCILGDYVCDYNGYTFYWGKIEGKYYNLVRVCDSEGNIVAEFTTKYALENEYYLKFYEMLRNN